MENMTDEDFIHNCDLVAKFIRVSKNWKYTIFFAHVRKILFICNFKRCISNGPPKFSRTMMLSYETDQ